MTDQPELTLTRRFADIPRLLAAGAVVLAVTGALVCALLIAVWMGVTDTGSAAMTVLVPAALALAVIGIALAMDKAVQIRRLQLELTDERLAADLLARRVQMHTALDAATGPINEELEADALLDEIVMRAADLIDATDGAVLLLEYGNVLRVGAAHGKRYVRNARRPISDALSARAMRERRAVLARQSDGSTLWSAPLVHRSDVVGVIELVTAPARVPIATDLHALALFAEPAADAIARVRVVEVEREYVDELLALDRTKRAYVSGIGHDLRTPLTSLRGAAAALRRSGDPRTQEDLLDVIDRQVARLASLAQALIDSDEAPLPLRLDLPGLVKLVALDSELAGRPVHVLAPEHLDVIADAEAIRRIVTNLIDNAYTHGAPPVTIEVRAEDGHALLSVSDCGNGVPVAERERIFEHAYRGMHHDRPGHGLGLAIVRSLAEACGGHAWVEPAAHGGATFFVSLRTRDASEQEAAWNLGPVS